MLSVSNLSYNILIANFRMLKLQIIEYVRSVSLIKYNYYVNLRNIFMYLRYKDT